jgi:hypothetical protein
MKKKNLIWIPRILTFLFCLFLSIFAFDVFDSKEPFLRILLGLLIHLIPSFILLGVFFVSLKYKNMAGTILIGLSIVFTLFFHTYQNMTNFVIVSLPVLVIGILFLLIQEK